MRKEYRPERAWISHPMPSDIDLNRWNKKNNRDCPCDNPDWFLVVYFSSGNSVICSAGRMIILGS